jgi:GNAT superfamily N-acetyltransferase
MKVFDPVEVGDVTITEMDFSSLSDDDILVLNAFENVMHAEAHPEDPAIPLEITRAEALNVPEFIGFRQFWARDARGAVMASGYAWWRKTEENRHIAWVGVDVRPDRRRRGLGRALLHLVVDVVEDEGRTTVIGYTSERVPAGESFARRVGAEPGSAVHSNRLQLSKVDLDLVRSWIEEGPVRAAGYSLVTIDGRYPDELIDQIAEVHGVMNTAPRDDLDIEDHVFTADQLRQTEKGLDASGTIRWSLFARCDATDELVGMTVVYWNPAEPKTIHQGDTGVHPDHRGHALGKWLKAAMIERILTEHPGVEDIRTGNADSNEPMLGINHALGFEPHYAMMNWQIPVDRLRAYVDGSSS